MQNRSRLVALVLCCLFSGGALAAGKEYRVNLNGSDSGWLGTPASACTSWVALRKAAGEFADENFSWNQPEPKTVYTGYAVGLDCQVRNQYQSEQSGQGYHFRIDVRDAVDCPSGQSSVNGECAPTSAEHCKAQMGKDTTVNWTVGYSRYPAGHAQAYDLVSPPNKVPSDGLMCVGGCKVAAEYGESTSTAYRSASPTAQGTYRLSMDFKATQLGDACAATQADAPADPKAPIPICPGNVGEVNGVTVCTGTAAAPVRNDTTGTEPAGAQEGNPAAGQKPSSGEGSGSGGAGRTPNTGDGGPGGGPAGAAGTGKGPDGTTNKPGEGKEQAACGAPGQPKCRIDETGTPDGKGVFDAAKKQIDDADKSLKDTLDSIKDKGDKDTSWGQTLGWVQHGGCTPWDLGTLPLGAGIRIQIDICPILPYIEWVTSFLWAITTFALTLAMVFRVTTSSGS